MTNCRLIQNNHERHERYERGGKKPPYSATSRAVKGFCGYEQHERATPIRDARAKTQINKIKNCLAYICTPFISFIMLTHCNLIILLEQGTFFLPVRAVHSIYLLKK